MAMARSPYGRKALWPFPTVQIPLLGGTTGPSRPRRIPDRTPTTRITPGTPASPPGGGVHIGTAARRRSEIASGSSSGITCKVPCPRPRGCAIAPSLANRRLDQPTPVIDRTSLPADARLSTGPPSADPRYRPDVKRHPLLRTWETPTFTHRECCLGGVAVFGRGRVGRGGRFGRGLAAGRERSDRNDAGPRPKRALVGGGARSRVMPGIPLRSMHSLHASSSVRRASAADGRRSSSSSFSR